MSQKWKPILWAQYIISNLTLPLSRGKRRPMVKHRVPKTPVPMLALSHTGTLWICCILKCFLLGGWGRGERERHFGSREREGKLKITFPFYGKGTGIRKLLREGKGNLRLVIPGIPGNPGNHIKSKIKFKIIFMPWQAIRSQSFFNQCKDDICNRFTQL